MRGTGRDRVGGLRVAACTRGISRILFSPASCSTSVAVNVLVTLPAPEPLISCRTAGSGGGRTAVTVARNEDDHAGGTQAGKLPRDSPDWGVRPAGGLCTHPGSVRPEPEQSAGRLSGRHEQPRGTQKRTGSAASCHRGWWNLAPRPAWPSEGNHPRCAG